MFRALDGRSSKNKGHTVLLVERFRFHGGCIVAAFRRFAGPMPLMGWLSYRAKVRRKVTILHLLWYAQLVSTHRGMALRDALDKSQAHGGTYLGRALRVCRGSLPHRL